MTYTYNSDGIRTQKTVGTVTTDYTLEGDKVVYETNGTDAFWYYYDESGAPVRFEYNGTTYYYVKNLQGDIIAILNASGEQVVEYKYDAWGNVSIDEAPLETIGIKNPYRYRGYRYDNETGLYYLQSRYYDPKIGRFINADSWEYLCATSTTLSCNLFTYCENNPVNMVDPDGNYEISQNKNYYFIRFNNWETNMLRAASIFGSEFIGFLIGILTVAETEGVSIPAGLVIGAVVGALVGTTIDLINTAGAYKGIYLAVSKRKILPNYIWYNRKEPKGYKNFDQLAVSIIRKYPKIKKFLNRYNKYRQNIRALSKKNGNRIIVKLSRLLVRYL